MEVTITILIITCIVSFMAFSNQAIIDKLVFYPPAVNKDREWYRFITCGLIHGDIPHLAFNMFSFFLFGKWVEQEFRIMFPGSGVFLYAIMYISALVVCLIPTYTKHKDNYYYKSLGASGAVSAVVFAGILLFPTSKIGLFFIPPIIPAFIFGPIYLFVTAYLDKKGASGINHSAHLWGALYGLAFLIVTSYFLSEFRPVAGFVEKVTEYIKNIF